MWGLLNVTVQLGLGGLMSTWLPLFHSFIDGEVGTESVKQQVTVYACCKSN